MALHLVLAVNLIAGLVLISAVTAQQVDHTTGPQAPVINAHMHSARIGMDDAAYRDQVLAEMDANHISLAVLHINETDDIADWVDAAPGRFLAGPNFPCWDDANGKSCDWDGSKWPDITWLRENYESGKLTIMGEMLFVYTGISPDDARMDKYWALAAELDIPVAIHINRGPPPGMPPRLEGCCPDFDADLGNPALLRPVLEKYPGLRIWLQHAGFPALPFLGGIDYLEETYALMHDYPNVYVDMTALNSVPPRPVHAAAVRQFLDRGFIDRIMMGTDNWDAAPIIERYAGFDFLTPQQKKGIFHDNAGRFFRLDEPAR